VNALLLLASFAVISPAPKSAPTYSVINKFVIGGEGGWDYLAIESDSHRLFISRGTHVMVLDVNTGKLVGDIPNTPGVHGCAFANKAGKGYSSNGRDDSVTVFDLATLKEIKRVKVGSRPDAIFFDAASNRVFTFNAGSSDATAIDVKTDTVAGSVPLGGKPEFPQVDGKGSLFVNIEDRSEISKVDTRSLKVVSSWKLAPGEEPSGLAIDTKNHVLFSTCSNNILAVSDYMSGKVIASPKIGNGPDAAGFDPGTGLAFSSNGQDGTLTIVGRKAGGSYDVLQTVKTQMSARTMTLDPKTHRVYLIAADFQQATNANGRRSMVPGSACILVVGPGR
jgi:YVTN family beta-propeller protein